MLPPGPTTLISKFGYLAVAGIIGLESLGLPLPGEATLIAAALYSGTGQQLNIWLVVASASSVRSWATMSDSGLAESSGFRRWFATEATSV